MGPTSRTGFVSRLDRTTVRENRHNDGKGLRFSDVARPHEVHKRQMLELLPNPSQSLYLDLVSTLGLSDLVRCQASLSSSESWRSIPSSETILEYSLCMMNLVSWGGL